MCHNTFFRESKYRDFSVPCSVCGTSVGGFGVDAWTWAQGQKTNPGDAESRQVDNMVLAASGGSRIRSGSSCTIYFEVDGITITPAMGQEPERLSYAEVVALQITGSTTRRNAGVIGGGFGLEGMAEGMMMAGVINMLSTRKEMYSVLRIATTSSEYVLVSHSVDHGVLNMMLTPVHPRIRTAQAKPAVSVNPAAPSATTSVADELTKLAKLRDDGVLTLTEFEQEKARLLRRV